DTDRMGVVYYSNYFVWFEIARTELFRHLKLNYKDIEKQGLYLVVAETSCRYLAPARYDDEVSVSCRVKEMRRSSLAFEYSVKRGDELLAEGKSVHVFTGKNFKPCKIPDYVKEKLK
ncbi:MAG: acyl-CoA thioesterase, partial [Candidatus Omnitrophica bacterium]|nr:acyl-CoA thioesterase [Candidatus Omnitrophota bacterium]